MSADSPLQSSLWYRVAAMQPRLQMRARLHRHRYRGELWYLLQDPASGRVHRFTPAARLILAAMNGQRSVDALWRLAQRHLGDGAPTQDEVIHLLGQLHGADLLATNVPPDALELFERGVKAATSKRRQGWMNPMALRVPLWDPALFLDRHAALWRWLWALPGALLWLALVLPALLLLPGHWADLGGTLSDRVLQLDNLLLLAVVFPLIKALHELGHATATHAAGGEVHDMGVMLLVGVPVPYVDASSATLLRSRWQRVLIGAAGMVVELFVAALAFYLWLAVEPGPVRALCFNIMLVAGVSTLVFNGNPLLRYDGYYMLADLCELPNLAQRSARYWAYLAARYLLREYGAQSPAASAGERVWFSVYGLASTLYRGFVGIAIALFIGSRFYFIGVVLALWAVVMMLAVPVVRALGQLARPGLRERRGRIGAVIGAAAAVFAMAAALVPLPYRSQAEGVIWLPQHSTLRSAGAGFVNRLEVPPGTAVDGGAPLVTSVDPALEAQVRLGQARVAELEASYGNEFSVDRARANIVRERLVVEKQALLRTQERARSLVAVAPVAGVFTVAQPDDLPGRFFHQGEVLGYVLSADKPVVRVVVEQAEVDVVSASRRVQFRLADAVGHIIDGRIVRQVPAGTEEAPSRALVAPGGGKLAADPRDPKGRRTLQRIFEIDVEPLAPYGRPVAFGQRVFVRFDMPPKPMATQVYRMLRRLFLTHFDV